MIEKELRNEIVKELEQMYRTLEINMENIKDYIKLLNKVEYKDAISTRYEQNLEIKDWIKNELNYIDEQKNEFSKGYFRALQKVLGKLNTFSAPKDDICQWKVEIKDKKFGSQFITCGHKRSEHDEKGRCQQYVMDNIHHGQKNYCFCEGFQENPESVGEKQWTIK